MTDEKDNGKYFIKYGVWDSYSWTTQEHALKAIKNSAYPAIVKNDAEGNTYITIPAQSDMW